MAASADDVSTTVEYSTDKWCMDRVPWAMWVFVVGLAFALYGGGRDDSGAALAFVYIALLGVALAGYALSEKLEESSIPFYLTFPAVMILLIIVMLIIDAVTGSTGRSGSSSGGSSIWIRLVDPPMHVGGWVMAYLASAWIAVSIYRHIRPPKPSLMLSPAGVWMHQPWLKKVLIPWQKIKDTSRAQGGSGAMFSPYMIAVQVSREFYEGHIGPKLSALAPPGTKSMFLPDGAIMTIVLLSSERAPELVEFRAALAERWKAFRDLDPSAIQAEAFSRTSAPPHIVHGVWRFDGSRWQTAVFLAPLVALAAVLLHALVLGK
ncbi:MAG TPA: hypothetical protein VFV47_07085 [Hyphomicrobiaceae bacterium]|nr:hypothetical protein [Hyphomicrobiaceae bacterium]